MSNENLQIKIHNQVPGLLTVNLECQGTYSTQNATPLNVISCEQGREIFRPDRLTRVSLVVVPKF